MQFATEPSEMSREKFTKVLVKYRNQEQVGLVDNPYTRKEEL